MAGGAQTPLLVKPKGFYQGSWGPPPHSLLLLDTSISCAGLQPHAGQRALTR